MAKNNVTVNKANKIKASFGSILFDTFNHIFLGLVAIICLYPLLYVLWASLSDPLSLMKHTGILWAPLQPPTLWGYRLTMQNKNILVGYKNTLFLVVVGTFLNVFFTAMAGYVLSRKTYLWRNLIMALITFTMFFGGGMIPTFLLVKGIGLYDSRWALIIPGIVSTYNLIITRTAMAALPDSLEESAKLDGAGDFTIFLRIALPLTKANIAVITLYYAVGHWNAWFNALLYLKTSRRYSDEYSSAWAYVKEDVFPALVDLVNDVDLAEKNGYHSTTHGLPQNFGGSVNVRYASGEKISFSDNQCPIMSISVANKIADLLEKAMAGEKIVLPDVKELAEIRFTELRSGGGFTKATLTLNGDGSGVNKKQSRYDDPKVYESEKPVDAATVAAIKSNISENGMLAWAGLPESGYFKTSEKSLTFVFKDGREITVGGAAALPGELGGGFFKIELELTAKN